MEIQDLGEIITFYSYKGGTGRTMALASVACLLGRGKGVAGEQPAKPRRVLAIDWDFEAPGLHRYFRPYLAGEATQALGETPGCLEIFEALDANRAAYDPSDFVGNRHRAREELEKLDLDRYLLHTRTPGLSIIKAGRFDGEYSRRVSELQWDRLFRDTLGLFAGFADVMKHRFDYVLVDSRTGITDTSGICTMLLPDKLVVVFTPNEQSLTGVRELVQKAISYRKESADGRPLTVFPLASRVEMARPTLLEAWRHGTAKGSPAVSNSPEIPIGYQPLFEQLFDEIYARSGTRLSDYFNEVMLPHVPDYAYGEPIAVELESGESTISLSGRYAAFTERLVELQAPWETLADVRWEAEIRKRCEETAQVAENGAAEEAVRLAYSVIDKRPPVDLFGEVARAVIAAARTAYPRDRRMATGLIERTAKLVSAETEADSALLAEILLTAGDLCLEFGDYHLATTLFLASRDRFSAAFSDEHPSALSAAGKLAQSLALGGNLTDAHVTEEQVVAARRRVLGEEHPDTLPSMHNLASTLRAQGDLAGARALQERVLEISRRVLGEEHPASLTSMNSLAHTLWNQGDLAGARALEERVLEVRRRVLGEEHPDTLTSMNNLAGTLADQGDLAGARALQEQVLAIRRRVLGEEHPDTLTSMNNLALTLRAQGDLAGARTLQERVLEISRRVLGEEHPASLTSTDNLASTLRAQGDLAGARALEERALQGRRRVLGEEHHDTLKSMNNLAITLGAQGDLARARTLEEQVLAIRRRVLGEEHPDTLTSMNNLAGTLGAQGDLAGARALQERVLEISRRVLGEEHPASLTSMHNLAHTLGAQGDLAGARALQERVLEIRRRVLGEEHPDTLTSMNNLARTLGSLRDLAGARALQEQALAVRRRVLGEEHPDTLNSMNNLARMLGSQGDLAGARALQEQALAVRRRVLGEEHPDTISATRGLADILNKLGEKDQAFELLSRAVSLQSGKSRPKT